MTDDINQKSLAGATAGATNENKEAPLKNSMDEQPYLVEIPPSSEWHKAPDLKVVDRKTGEVVKVLEMITDFPIVDGVTLRIKAKEIQDWEKETAKAKDFNENEKNLFVETITKINSRPLSRKEIVQIIQEIKKPNKTFRQSRELIDNKLNRDIEKDQLTFEDLMNSPSGNLSTPPEAVIKGLDLDQGEDRLVHTLTLLLAKKSQNKDQKSPDYYMGNYEKGITRIKDIEMETARIIVTPHELYSTYYGKDDYNSDHIKYVLGKLDGLAKKQYWTAWNIQVPPKKKGEKKKINKLRTCCPLFQIVILNQDLSESQSQEIDTNENLIEGKKCVFLFKFQPQFTNNIRERYVEFPEDIYHRIADATGKNRYSQSINLMRDLLFREKQQKRSEITRDQETLIKTLKLDKFWKEGRKKIVNEKLEEAFNVFKKIGLIKDTKETRGVMGQTQYIISINRDFK